MPPRFRADSFDFTDEQAAPDHVEGSPRDEAEDPDKYQLDGTDMFDYEDYPLAVNVDDLATALLLQEARQRHINRTQPDAETMRDRTTIRYPEAQQSTSAADEEPRV